MSHAQKVGFVSLGCPKALVDSERILTQLRFDGYEVSPLTRTRALLSSTPAALSTAQKKNR